MDKLPNLFAALVVPSTDFANAPLYVFFKPLEEVGTALKVATGYRYDNKHFRIERGLEEFAFSMTQERAAVGSPRHQELVATIGKEVRIGPNGGNAFTLRVWDRTGTSELFVFTFIGEIGAPTPLSVLHAAFGAMDNYVAGIRACSDCGTPIPTTSRNRYFAGAYCDPCWLGEQGSHKGRGGWKAVEGRETYD